MNVSTAYAGYPRMKKKTPKKATRTTPYCIGTYCMGWDNVELWVSPNTAGGSLSLCPEKDGKLILPNIVVGLDHQSWNSCIEVLLHEVFEYLLTRHHYRYDNSLKLRIDHTSYLFVFDHCQLSDVCCYAAEMLTKALPDLARAYKAQHKK